MANQNPSLYNQFQSVAEQMLEAIEKAAWELSQTATKSVEQLGQYNLNLQNLFTEQLRQASNQHQLSINQEFQALSQYKEKCISELDLFEQAQIETVVSTGCQLRESLDRHAEQCQEKLLEMFGKQPDKFRELVREPLDKLSELAQEHTASVLSATIKGKGQIDAASAMSEELISSKIQELEQTIQKLIDEGKLLIHSTFNKAEQELQDKATNMRQELDNLFQESLSQLDKATVHQGSAVMPACKEDLGHAVSESSLVAKSTFATWNQAVNQLNDSFAQFLQDCFQKHKVSHQKQLDLVLGETKDKIGHLSRDAQDRAKLTHKAFHQHLKELTQAHGEHVEVLLLRFENLLFALSQQSSEIASMEEKTARALKEKLKAKLVSAGAELTASLAKLATCLETEYVKSSQEADQKLENLSTQLTESLEKQIQLLKNELKRVSKTFQDALDALEDQLAEIEVAGAKASEMVMTYKNAFL